MSNKSLIIRLEDLALELGVSKTTIWRWRKNGLLPTHLSFGPRVIGWERSVIEEWIESKRGMDGRV